MAARRIREGILRGQHFEIEVDGEHITAYEGETIAAALIAAGKLRLRYTAKSAQPRGVYCGIGLCHDCIVAINGVPNIRACQILATPGCRVESQEGLKRKEGGA
jgi:hypothetical protein